MMIAGWVAIMKYQSAAKLPTLTTIHSWVGVITVVVFGFNYFVGFFNALLTTFYPDFVLRQAINLNYQHKKLGATAFLLTTMTIITGIMNQLPQGMCYYDPNDDTVRPGYDTDPSAYYPQQSNSCRIGLGLGVTVLLAAFFALGATLDRAVGATQPTTEDSHPKTRSLAAASVSNSASKRAIPLKGRSVPTPPPPTTTGTTTTETNGGNRSSSRPRSEKKNKGDEDPVPEWLRDGEEDEDVESGKTKSRRKSKTSSSSSSARRQSAIQMDAFSSQKFADSPTTTTIPVAVAIDDSSATFTTPTRRSSTSGRPVPPPPGNTTITPLATLSSRRRSALDTLTTTTTTTTAVGYEEPSAPAFSYMHEDDPLNGAGMNIPPPPSYRPSMTPILMEQAATEALHASSPTPNRLPGRRSSQTKSPPPPPPPKRSELKK